MIRKSEIPEFPFWCGSRLVGYGPGYLLFHGKRVYALMRGDQLSELQSLLGNSRAFDKTRRLNHLTRCLLFFGAGKDAVPEKFVEHINRAIEHAIHRDSQREASAESRVDEFKFALSAAAKLRPRLPKAATEHWDYQEKIQANAKQRFPKLLPKVKPEAATPDRVCPRDRDLSSHGLDTS